MFGKRAEGAAVKSPAVQATPRKVEAKDTNDRVDEASPICDARLLDGSRVNVIAPPLSIDGPALTIRKFKKDKLRLADLVNFKSISPAGAKVLQIIGACQCNIVISGGTGSGKTTLLNALTGFIHPDERIITCEDAAELQLQMNTGHDGSMGTLHANSPREALSRLESMITMGGFSLPAKTIREMIVGSVDVIVQATRLRDGSRRITNITEVIGMEGDVIVTQDLIVYEMDGEDANGNIIGEHKSTGIARPAFWDRARYFNLERDLAEAKEKLKAEDSGSRRKQIEETLGKIEERQKTKKKKAKTIESRLIQADWSMKPQNFIMMSFILAAVFGVLPFILGLPPLACAGLAFVMGFGLPRLLSKNHCA